MANENNGLMIGGISFLTGLLVGGAIGVLYAPQLGARTRRRIQDFADDMKERAGEMVDDANGAINRMVDQGRRYVNS